MVQDANRQTRRILGWVTLAGGLLTALFWLLYLSNAADLGQHHPLFHEFELAFPVADGVLAVLLFAASYCLLTGRPSGPFCLVAAASMSLYLGILDLTFYGRQGLYFPLTGSGLIALAINALCIGGGTLGLRLGWQLWRTG
jgi:hypothetical protein